jgi:phosphatidate cytidylyltransferase
MALQTSVLKTRSLTAILFVAVMCIGLFVNAWTYAFLFLFLVSVAWIEFTRLIDRVYSQQTHPYVTMGWVLNSWALCLLFSNQRFEIGSFSLRDNLLLPFNLAGFILLAWGTIVSKNISFKHWLATAAGNLYLSLPIALALHLYGLGPLPDVVDLFFSPALWWVLIAILTMWVNDTMAYLLGSLIGRTPFSKISPKKTWEGTIGGIVSATALIGWLLDRCFYDVALSPLSGYILITLLAIAGAVGDLFESKLKRMAGVKDSGNLMPGHGGVLDRFDSLLFALPVLYLFLRSISLFVNKSL